MIYNHKELISQVFLESSQIFRPPERVSVAEAAEKYRYLKNIGSYIGQWNNTLAPYMVEPMNELNNPDLSGLIFVGSAQSSKTDSLIINWLAYSVVADPMDMIVYNPSMSAARDFSVRRIDRLHRHSEAVGSMLKDSRDSDNKFDKHYVNGMMLTLSWPSSTELAGRPIARVAFTDYDRMDDDIDGEGSGFDLGSKRTTTFGSYGMTLAESSPSRDITDPKWIASSPHEAPPTTGILALYNRGDRRRWYWPCLKCNHYFEPSFDMIEYDDKGDNLSTSETARMVCPKCSHRIRFDDRHEMQQWGVWLKEGEAIDSSGRKYGKPLRSSIASFWMKGTVAAFTSWKKLVETYLSAKDEYNKTGSDEALKKFYNTDLAEIYIPKGMNEVRVPETLKSRAERLGEKVVPEGTRFLVACVDVQKNMFKVQIHGISPGTPFDIVIVDRFDVYKSQRIDDDEERLWVKPSTYLEDWNELIENVIDKEYPLGDGSGRMMSIKMTLCDSGGKSGATTNAYNFYRELKRINKHGRFHLLKGDGNPKQVRTRISYPDSDRKDRNAGARGDIPVLMLNSHVLKDALDGRLDSTTPGKGMMRFPNWLPDWFYSELCSETRTEKGWVNPSHSRNEAWDLAYYCIGACLSKLIQVDILNWNTTDSWYSNWDTNNMIRKENSEKVFANNVKLDYDFGKLGQKLA